MCRLKTPLVTILLSSIFSSLILLLPSVAAAPDNVPPEGNSVDLSNLFSTGYILQDRNQDEVIDFVNVMILLSDSPSEAEAAGAANIAARLGYETSAIDLDLVELYSDRKRFYDLPVIVVGGGKILEGVISHDRGDSPEHLRPGQGSISRIPPDSYFRQGGIIVGGYDATGLISAAEYLSGRYPSIWKMEGKTYEDILESFTRFLEERDIDPEEITLDYLVVDAEKGGVTKLAVSIRLSEEELYRRSIAAFEGEEDVELEEKKLPGLSDLEFSDLHRIEVKITCPMESHLINLLPDKPWQTKPGASRSSSASPDFTLSGLYSIEGLFRDSNQDFVPDDVICYLSVSGSDAAGSLGDLAARIGLESAGIRLPLVRVSGEEDYPEEHGFPIIYGIDHYQVKRVEREGKLYGAGKRAGEGYLRFIEGAFNEKNGLLITASDEQGLQVVSDYVAERLPYLWEYGKGNYRLEDVEREVQRFFQTVKAGGQVSLALTKLNTWLERIGDREIERIDVEISAREKEDGLEDYVQNLIRQHYPSAEVTAAVYKTGFGVGKTIFEEEFEVPWEVDEFWSLFRNEALPRIRAGNRGRIVVRVSESPEVRTRLKREIEEELKKRGVDAGNFEVQVYCAYKQGYSWLHDGILPKIRGRDVGGIEIRYHTLKDSREVRWQAIHANTRWLQEIFPVDSVLARELGIPDSLVTFKATQVLDPVYEVRVTDSKGSMILEESFNPKYVVRPFYDLFPEYESVRVTTGWVNVESEGRTLLDSRISTDPETFWDHLQAETYRKIIDYVMDIQEGRPSSNNAPYFDEFNVDLVLSEPNYRIGVDEEVISSLEALHEDIFFETLTLFSLIGGRYGAGSMSYPGRILPYVRSSPDGGPGRVKIVMKGKERAHPELVMTCWEKGREPVKQRYSLTDLGVDPPKLRGISVRSGTDNISQLLFEVVATDSTDRYEEFKLRGTEASIDRSFISVEKLADMVRILGQLQEEELFEEEMSFDRVEELLFRFTLEDSTAYSRFVSLPRSRRPASTKNPALHDRGFKHRGEPIVQWETPIPPAECRELLAKLNTFPNINTYYMATSLLGEDLFAIDLYPPTEARFISQAKLNAWKPSLMLQGRVHGNEVSSTSHILRLAELCATDSTYMNFLKNVNLVLYPITNPDGARIAYEMWMENPDFMLHVGRPGALGADVGSGRGSVDSRYPEAGMVYRLREAWLPDIVIDMHGVPSHEWVQYFAGYSAWVRSRYGGARSYWLPRGWYIPGFSWIDDEKYPELETAQKAITDSIVTAVTSLPEVDAMNRRVYDRYIKYGTQDMETYREYFYKGIQLEARLRGRTISGSGVTSPRITYYSITTEAADETAYGQWLELVCEAGLAHSSALLRYLSDGVNEIEYAAQEYEDYVIRSAFRKKPVLPKEEKKDKEKEKKDKEMEK